MNALSFLALALLSTAAHATEDPRATPTERVVFLLKVAAEADGNTILSVKELEAMLGPHDRTADKSVLVDKKTLIYQFSGGRELQVYADGGLVVYAAVVPKTGKWELVWK